MEPTKEQISKALQEFDIDDSLWREKQQLDEKLNNILIRFEAMKITRGIK